MPRKPRSPGGVVPKKYGGKWVAWNHEGTQIIASGESIAEVVAAAKKTGEEQPLYQVIPRSDAYFMGGGGLTFRTINPSGSSVHE